jgi:hypothetical protein
VADERFAKRAKVVAAVDLPGVPAGTPGRIVLEAGFRWFRYWVRFENGVELGSVGREKLMSRKEWERTQAGTAV